ncbi:MAG: GcvT family protein [Rhodospirillales bacterium]|nr:GcvT family protein [Rhodospirillales bacterium]
MSDTVPASARVAIIGGGILGCSVLYHLARRGWREIVLLERTELTAGSTWHAAGNTPHFSTSLNLSRIQHESTKLYQTLEAETGQAVQFHRTGSLRLASVPNRMDEYRFHAAKAKTIGLPFHLVTPAEIARLHPLITTDGVLGAAHNPEDGHVDPSSVTQALAAGARARGAQVLRHTRATGVEHRPDGRWRIDTDKGAITADIVVNAAGTWAREIGALAGLDLPIVAIEHQYLVFDAMPEVMALKAEPPIVREVDVSYYLRQERQGMLLGPYERNPVPFGAHGVPKSFGADLLPPDLDRLEPIIEGAFRRMPCLAKAGMKRVVNGPITYTPDGNALLGPAPGQANHYLACGYSFGITQAGGSGRWLADLIVDGYPPFDLFELDPRRYGRYAALDWTIARCKDIYADEYAIAYPNQERPVGRDARLGPLHATLKAKGAVFGSRNGWERPQWFAAKGETPEDKLSFRRTNWFAPMQREARMVREKGGLLDLSSFSKYEVGGPDAAKLLDRLVANKLPKKIGGIALCHMLLANGYIRSEVTVTRLAEDRFFLVTAAAAQLYDLDWIRQHVAHEERVTVEDLSEAWGCLVVAGPQSRAALSRHTNADLGNAAFPWRTMRPIVIAGAEVRALRLNYVGELGWELFMPAADLPKVYAALSGEGLGDFGFRAMDSLRIEKSYRGWGSDINTEVTPLEAGFDRFVALDKGDFIGRDALLKQKAEGVRKRVVTLSVEASDTDARGNEPVFDGDRVVGITTSGTYGAWTRQSLAIAYVDADRAAPGTALSVELMGERRAARVIPDSPFDPENVRLRG